jgi:plasmid stabilization system protein ParE
MAEISYHPEAEAEIQAATAWYLSRSQAAAIGLVEEIDRTMAMIQQFPELQPAYDERHRFAVLRRYPYSIIYRKGTDRLRVIAFAHPRRRAGYWQGRS